MQERMSPLCISCSRHSACRSTESFSSWPAQKERERESQKEEDTHTHTAFRCVCLQLSARLKKRAAQSIGTRQGCTGHVQEQRGERRGQMCWRRVIMRCCGGGVNLISCATALNGRSAGVYLPSSTPPSALPLTASLTLTSFSRDAAGKEGRKEGGKEGRKEEREGADRSLQMQMIGRRSTCSFFFFPPFR
eukprot:3104927-Rhodomonas_salina.1